MPGLNHGEMPLNKSLRALRVAWDGTGDAWRDRAREEFGQDHVLPWLDEGATVVHAMESLSALLEEAIRACS